VLNKTELLDIARATGLREHLHGLNATQASGLLARYVSAVQAAMAAQQPDGELLRQCVEAVANGVTATHHHTLEWSCLLCGVSLDTGPNHLPDCLTLRAKTYLTANPAAQPLQPGDGT
jgi:hypothetical protein